MEFKKIVSNYSEEFFKEIEVAKTSNEATRELSFRTSLDNFFKNVARSISPQIATIPEPRNQNKKGRPDWRFHDDDDMGVYGYVEAKGFDSVKPINISDYIAQVNKYLCLGSPVILTDGIEFICFYPDDTRESYQLIQKPVDFENPTFNLETEVLFKKLFKESGYRATTDKQLIEEVAVRAKNLTSEIHELLELDIDEAESVAEQGTIETLKSLKTKASASSDSSLKKDEVLSSYLSQIITFGLLYAHRKVEVESLTPKEKYHRLKNYWLSQSKDLEKTQLTPFKYISLVLEKELSSNLSRLGLWYDDLCCLLSHIKLSSKQVFIPNFHELYEAFLTTYNPKVRFDYGAFYTPNKLANFTTKLTDKILKNAFDDDKQNKLVYKKVIDPCCGTGTFLESAIENLNINCESELIGFEILPAPYALCQYRMASITNSNKSKSKIKVLLTNTLSDGLLELPTGKTHSFWQQEENKAHNLSCPPINLVIGNPPSSDSKFTESNEGQKIIELLEDFRPPKEDRKSRQNTQKQLTNEFVKFLRWSLHKTLESDTSAFSLILPSTFAEHPSYMYARKFIADNFEQIWVLEFDADQRAESKGQNLFETLQGRLVIIGLNSKGINTKQTLKYKNISDLTKEEKLNYIMSENIDLIDWDDVSLDKENYSFKSSNENSNSRYLKFWPLTAKDNKNGIYERHCSSVKLAPTHLLVHADAGQLKRRTRFISKSENSYKEIISDWYKGQSKPPSEAKITPTIKDCLAKTLKGQFIVNYSYRPFIEANVIFEPILLQELAKLGGGGTRARPEVIEVFNNKDTIAFAVSPAPKDISNTLEKFSSFCWFLPDNDLTTRGNAHVFSNYFPAHKKQSKAKWDKDCKPNFNSALIDSLQTLWRYSEGDIYKLLPFYVYAVLSSDTYLTTFHDFLYSVAGSYPRIPITTNKAYFVRLAKQGKALAEIESNQFEPNFTNKIDLSTKKYFKYKISSNCITLFDDKKNTVAELQDIEPKILNFKVSGYLVIKEWLKLHSYPYLRKPLTADMSIEFNKLLAKINLYINEVIKADQVIVDIIKEDQLLEYKNS